MLVYLKNRHGQVTEIDVEPQETMREVVMKIEELGGIEKVGINMIKYSCGCDNDLTEILLEENLARKMIFCINLWIVIFSKILQIASYKMIFLVSRQGNHQDASKYIDGSFLNSPPQCFDTLILSKSTSTNIFQKENGLSIDLNKKINDQLIEIRKSCHREYISSNCNAVIDNIIKDTQIDNDDVNKKSNGPEVVDSTSPKAKTEAWARGTCLVTGDSMLSYIDETRMLRKFNIKVKYFHGANTDYMFHCLVPLLEKKNRLCHSAYWY